MDEGTKDKDVGDKLQVEDIGSTNADAERGRSRKRTRGGEKREKRTHTETNDAILDERRGCLNTSKSLLLDNQVGWYERAVSRECGLTRRRCTG